MIIALSRGLFKSVHLIHTKPIPPNPQSFTQRGLPVLLRSSELKAPAGFKFSVSSASPLKVPDSSPNTRFPMKDKVVTEVKTVKATRKFLRSSIMKISEITHNLKKLHVEDAISLMENCLRKPAMWVKNILKAGVRSAVNIKGMSEDRLYIKEILLGKNRGVPGIRYHAKGRAGRMMRARTQITFVIEEKTVEQLYRVIMTGKFSPSIANILRGLLLSQNSSYQDIRRIQNLLTAKGRQQQKLIYKRKVEMTLEEQKAKGLILDKDYVMEQLLLEDGKKFAEEYWEFKRLETEKKIAERQEVYNKNQKSR